MDTGKMTYSEALCAEIKSNLYINHDDNFDYYRFPEGEEKLSLKERFKRALSKNYKLFSEHNKILNQQLIVGAHSEELANIYNLLEDQKSKECLISIMAYRILGHKKYKLPTNNSFYWNSLKKAESLMSSDSIEVVFQNGKLYYCDLESIGYAIKMFYNPIGILIDFMLEQYAYENNNGHRIEVADGDTVIDCGGCYGDTALYFASKQGQNAKTYVFEFIPSNIEILSRNIELNPDLKDNIVLVPNPVFSESEIDLFYEDNGPGSRVSDNQIGSQNDKVKTISIDDLVKIKGINRVDFIKMDIEGAEIQALRGAVETIVKHKPKLAIAVYHSLEEYYTIPQLIKEIEPGYRFYMGHYTIHQEESVLFAEYVV